MELPGLVTLPSNSSSNNSFLLSSWDFLSYSWSISEIPVNLWSTAGRSQRIPRAHYTPKEKSSSSPSLPSTISQLLLTRPVSSILLNKEDSKVNESLVLVLFLSAVTWACKWECLLSFSRINTSSHLEKTEANNNRYVWVSWESSCTTEFFWGEPLFLTKYLWASSLKYWTLLWVFSNARPLSKHSRAITSFCSKWSTGLLDGQIVWDYLIQGAFKPVRRQSNCQESKLASWAV